MLLLAREMAEARFLMVRKDTNIAMNLLLLRCHETYALQGEVEGE